MTDVARGLYFDRQGNEISAEKWRDLLESAMYKVVAVTESEPPGGWSVSTVWLGLDHAFGDGPPRIFETMVFGIAVEGEPDNYCRRYTTEAEAEAGHEEVVAMARAAEEKKR